MSSRKKETKGNIAILSFKAIERLLMKADYILDILFLFFWCAGDSGGRKDAIQVEEVPAGAAHVCA